MIKKRITYLLTGLLLFLASSFIGKNTNQVKSDSFVFGLFYGECEGTNCVQVYKLDKNSLYKDEKPHYPSFHSFYNGNFKKLSNEKYKQVCKISTKIPNELLKNKSGVIGEPDAGDWGGFYIAYSQKGVKKFWIIDKNKNNLPKYLHTFVDDIEKAIKQLNK